MLLLILLAAALAPSQQGYLECADVASTQTEPVAGPAGASAVFKLTTEDDHSKNSHLCNAEYRLLISGAAGTPHVVDVLTSNGDWGRSLSLRLSDRDHAAVLNGDLAVARIDGRSGTVQHRQAVFRDQLTA